MVDCNVGAEKLLDRRVRTDRIPVLSQHWPINRSVVQHSIARSLRIGRNACEHVTQIDFATDEAQHRKKLEDLQECLKPFEIFQICDRQSEASQAA